jgi:hypothetical protein
VICPICIAVRFNIFRMGFEKSPVIFALLSGAVPPPPNLATLQLL